MEGYVKVNQTENERIAVLEVEVEAMKRDINDMKGDLRIIRDTLLQAKGGWKTLMLVAGLASTVGALLTKFLPFMLVKP